MSTYNEWTLRGLDGYEAILLACTLSAGCSLKEGGDITSVCKTLETTLPQYLEKYPALRLSVSFRSDASNAPVWDWADPCNLEPSKLYSVVDAWPDDKEPEYVPLKAKQALFHVRLSTNGSEVGIRVDAYHLLCDGRSVFYILQLMKRAALGIPAEQDSEPVQPLCQFGHKGCFVEEAFRTAKEGMPARYKNFINRRVVPHVPEGTVFKNRTWKVPRAPIASLAKRCNGGMQAVAMSVYARAFRKCYGLADELPLPVIMPTDTRFLSSATPEYRRQQFFSHAGTGMTTSVGHGSLTEDIKYCAQEVRDSLARQEGCIALLVCTSCVDEATLKFTWLDEGFPNTTEQLVINTSSIGDVSGYVGDSTWAYFGLDTVCSDSCCYTNMYSYSVKDTIYFTLLYPDVENAFLGFLDEEIKELVKLASN